MKTVLSFLTQVIGNYLTEGEKIINNDDYLTFKAADGKTYRIDVIEVSE